MTTTPRVRFERHARWSARGRPALSGHLADHWAVGLRGVYDAERASAMVERVLAVREAWTADFEGEQFALGRAFYTHLETGRSKEYFAHARESDALVEQTLPGMQAEVLALMSDVLGVALRPRRGFCGAGVHVFPAAGKVAREGGVVHFDLEGLTSDQLARRLDAKTLVVMLQPGRRGGGLRLWDRLERGRSDHDEPLDGVVHTTVRYEVGDALVIDSRRLHQIRPFRGDIPRISITLHAAEIDRGVWETWF